MPQWSFTDESVATPITFSFPVNPLSFQRPGRESSVSSSLNTAPNGGAVIFQGRDSVPTGSFGGIVRSESHFNDMVTWADKWYPLTLTDDQGSTWTIVIQKLSWERQKRANNQWRYDYTLDFLSI